MITSVFFYCTKIRISKITRGIWKRSIINREKEWLMLDDFSYIAFSHMNILHAQHEDLDIQKVIS